MKCLPLRRGEKAVAYASLAAIIPTVFFSASQSEGDINADIAEFFASRPLELVELFADPIVRMRIGSLIRESRKTDEVAAQSQAR